MPDKWFGILDLFDHGKKVEKSKKEPVDKVRFCRKMFNIRINI